MERFILPPLAFVCQQNQLNVWRQRKEPEPGGPSSFPNGSYP